MSKVMNKPEPFFWGGVILTGLGLVGTGVSAYFVATKPKKDKNATSKTVGLILSIVMALIGIALLVYYKMGSTWDGAGECPLEQLSENLQTQYPPAGNLAAPAPAPMQAPAPVVAPPPPQGAVFNINVNPQKPV
jgi:hypothetical protein